jgi:hypothetical protein
MGRVEQIENARAAIAELAAKYGRELKSADGEPLTNKAAELKLVRTISFTANARLHSRIVQVSGKAEIVLLQMRRFRRFSNRPALADGPRSDEFETEPLSLGRRSIRRVNSGDRRLSTLNRRSVCPAHTT